MAAAKNKRIIKLDRLKGFRVEPVEPDGCKRYELDSFNLAEYPFKDALKRDSRAKRRGKRPVAGVESALWKIRGMLTSESDLAALSATWLEMANQSDLQSIERAAVSGLRALTGAPIAYIARRQDEVWTISAESGLSGDVAGLAVPEADLPYAADLRAGKASVYEDPSAMGPVLAAALDAVGLAALYAAPIMRDETCIGAVAIGYDRPKSISARERTLVELFRTHLATIIGNRELVNSLELLAESVPEIVLRTDPSGWINWYNRRWYEFTGQTREEAAGWGWQTAHHPVDFQRVMEEWPRCLATGQPIAIEFRLKRYDGVYHWHLARVEPVRDDKGRIISWYGTVVDIEEQKAALERSKRIADALQTAFLPPTLPQRERLQLSANYVSAEEDARVGGDWYDAFELPSGELLFSIGDVGGHGLPASLAVGRIRQTIFSVSHRTSDPGSILKETDRLLRIQEPDIFVTALVGIVSLDERTIRYASAGHPPPIVAYPDRPMPELPTGGPPMGASDNPDYRTHDVAIEPDATFVLYTDGLIEFRHDANQGERVLRETVARLQMQPLSATPAQDIYRDVLGTSAPPDDVAILVLRFSPPATGINKEIPLIREWRFHASDAHTAHAARGEVGEYLRAFGDEVNVFTSELIVGELLANTVEHAPGLVHLTVDWSDDHPLLIVRDNGPGLRSLAAELPDVYSEGNRGLYLIKTLAVSWSIENSASGATTLSVVLPVRRRGHSSR